MRHRTVRLLATMLVVAGCGAAASGLDTSVPAGRGSVASDGTTVTTKTATTTATTTATAIEAIPDTAPPGESLPDMAPLDASLPDMALVSADGRVAVVRDGAIGEPFAGLIAGDDETLISTVPGGGTTTVAWSSLADGRQIGTTTLDGDLRAVATDVTGEFVAMVGVHPDIPNGTEVVVTTSSGQRFRQRYDTELLPEGFSNALGSDGLPIGMFVQEFLDPPIDDAEAPRRYQVRVLDTATGVLQLPLNLRDKTELVDEQMLGFSRTHLMSRASGLLFTLYRGIDDDESNYAFVHTLGFVNGVWCLDLPGELSLQSEFGAMGLIDRESRLLVVSANGFVTEFVVDDITDPGAAPAPRRTVQAWTPGPQPAGPTVATSGTSIVVGQGSSMRWIDPGSLTETSSTEWDMQIESLAVLDGGDVVAAGSGRVSQIRPAGDLVTEQPLPAGFAGVVRMLVLTPR